MDEAGLIIEMEDSFQCWITDETGQRELVFEVSKPTWNDEKKRQEFLVKRMAEETLALMRLFNHGS